MTASQYKEFKAADVDKAVKLATKELGVGREKLRYDVLSFGSSGIFGIMPARNAKIRVPLPKEAEETQPKKKNARKSKKKDAPVSAVLLEERAGELTEEVGTPSEKKKKRSRKPKAKTSQKTEAIVEVQPPKEATPVDSEQLNKNKELAEILLRRILNYLSPEADLQTRESSRKINYLITGGDNAFLVGAKGNSVEAIRYVLEKVLHRGSEDQRLRVDIDVDDYAKKKRQKLVETTMALAEKCEETHDSQVIGRLSARERRVVNLLVKKYPNIVSKTSGTGDKRLISLSYMTGETREEESE